WLPGGIRAARERGSLRLFGRGRAGACGHREIRALDLANVVGLEDVAFLDVVEVLEVDAALEALLDLAHVVLEGPQLGDRRVVDHGALADDAAARAAADDAARDVAAGDGAD